MTITHAIGYGSNKVIRLIVRGLALSRIHPNVLTFLGLVINMVAAYMLAVGQFRWPQPSSSAPGCSTWSTAA